MPKVLFFFLATCLVSASLSVGIFPSQANAEVTEEYQIYDKDNYYDIEDVNGVEITEFEWKSSIQATDDQTNIQAFFSPDKTPSWKSALQVNIGDTYEDAAYLTTDYLQNVRLDEIEEISFYNYISGASMGEYGGPVMIVYVDVAGDGYSEDEDAKLIFEVINNCHQSENEANCPSGIPQKNSWDLWRALPESTLWRDLNGNIAPSGAGITFSDILNSYPDAIIDKEDQQSFQIGANQPNTNIYFDNITFDLLPSSQQEGALHELDHPGAGFGVFPSIYQADVTVCKQTQDGSPLDGWQMVLLNEPAFINVSFSDSQVQSDAGYVYNDIFIGVSDREFFLRVNGTYDTGQSGDLVGDAHGPSPLYINNAPVSWQPIEAATAYGASGSNSYYHYYNHRYGGPLRFHFLERELLSAQNNDLSVDIFESYEYEKEITGQQAGVAPGCVLYEEVGYETDSEFSIIEIQQEGWELVNIVRDDVEQLENGQLFTLDGDTTFVYTNRQIDTTPDPVAEVEVCIQDPEGQVITTTQDITLGTATQTTSSADGCTTFVDVPYATVGLSQQLAADWEFVRLLDEGTEVTSDNVVIDQQQEQFIFVNQLLSPESTELPTIIIQQQASDPIVIQTDEAAVVKIHSNNEAVPLIELTFNQPVDTILDWVTLQECATQENQQQVYLCLEMQMEEIPGALEQAVIQFVISRSWIEEQGVDLQTISLFQRGTDSMQWREVPVELIDDSQEEVLVYMATINAFAQFAVSGQVLGETDVIVASSGPEEQIIVQILSLLLVGYVFVLSTKRILRRI